MKGVITRTLTRAECPWLSKNVELGETVYLFEGPDYGVIRPAGIGVSRNGPFKYPVFEVPPDAVEWTED